MPTSAPTPRSAPPGRRSSRHDADEVGSIIGILGDGGIGTLSAAEQPPGKT
jgi:hypothetical protein